jgi:hypothetical protein
MWSAKYRAYGNLAALDVSEIDNPLRFQGQYFDAETGYITTGTATTIRALDGF